MRISEQFIYGKLVGEDDTGYVLVGHTNGLSEEKCEAIGGINGQYRFWGSTAPSSSSKAVGVFLYETYLVLVKAAPASYDGRLVKSGTREFDQYWYIFLSLQDALRLQVKLYELFEWLWDKEIPVYSEIQSLGNPDLQISVQSTLADYSKGAEMVSESLKDKDSNGTSFLIWSVVLLANGYRLVLDKKRHDASASLEVFLSSIPLLLPVDFRKNLFIALGDVDESYCKASLIGKTSSITDIEKDCTIFWIDRYHRAIKGDQSLLESLQTGYGGLINDLLQDQNEASLFDLIQYLDRPKAKIESSLSDHQFLQSPELFLGIISLFPEDGKKQAWDRYLSSLNKENLSSLICGLTEKSELLCVWKKLWLDFRSADNIKLLGEIWVKVPEENRVELLQTLVNERELLEEWLKEGTFDQVEWTYSSGNAQERVVDFSQRVVSQKAKDSHEDAWCVAKKFINIFQVKSREEQFLLLDKSLLGSVDKGFVNSRFNQFLSPLIISLKFSDLESSNLLRLWKSLDLKVARMLQDLIFKKYDVDSDFFKSLISLSIVTEMEPLQKDEFYFSVLDGLSLSEEQIQLFACEWMLRCDLFVSCQNASLQKQTLSLVKQRLNSGLVEQIDNILRDPFNWKHWENFFEDIWSGHPNIKAKYLDFLQVPAFYEFRLRTWLGVLADMPQERRNFEESYTWSESKDSVDYEIIQIILGKRPFATPNVKTYLNKAEGISGDSSIVFKLLEEVPGHSSDQDNACSLKTLMNLLSIYLYKEKVVTPDNKIYKSLKIAQPSIVKLFQCIQDKQEFEEDLEFSVAKSPDIASNLAYWLIFSHQSHRIKGSLLQCLIKKWLKNSACDIEVDILHRMNFPEMTKSWKEDDWIAIAPLWWKYELDVELPARAYLSEGGQQKLLAKASEVVEGFIEPMQTDRLLRICHHWGLEAGKCQEILRNVSIQACNVKQLLCYLFPNRKLIELDDALLDILLRVEPTSESIPELINFLTKILIQIILGKNVDWDLESFHFKVYTSKIYIELYHQAFSKAVDKVIVQNPNYLQEYYKKIDWVNLIEEEKLVSRSALKYQDLWARTFKLEREIRGTGWFGKHR